MRITRQPGVEIGTYDRVTPVFLTLDTLDGADGANYTFRQPFDAVPLTNPVQITKVGVAGDLRPGTMSVRNGAAGEYTYDLRHLLPSLGAGMTFGEVSYALNSVDLPADYYTGGAKVEGSILTLPIQAVSSADEGEIGTVTVGISSTNFENFEATVKVSSTNKPIPAGTPKAVPDAITYGQSIDEITLTGTMMAGETEVEGTFAWAFPDRPDEEPDKEPDTGSYTAAWTFTPNETDIYETVQGATVIQVKPADLQDAVVNLTQDVFAWGDPSLEGLRVESVVLDGKTLETSCYSYVIPNVVKPGTYTIAVTGSRYCIGTATATFTVNPVETVELDRTDAQGRELRV